MKREVNMRATNPACTDKNIETDTKKSKKRIITDPFGSWTGVCENDKYDTPIQDADDLQTLAGLFYFIKTIDKM